MPAVPRFASAQAPTPAPAPPTLREIAIAEDRRQDDGSIARGLESSEPSIQARAALAAGRLQDSTWVPRLLPLLGSANADTRHEAAFALGQIGHASARQSLEALADHPDLTSARLAVEALGKLGDHAATPRVLKALGHFDAGMRGEAAVALWRLADSTAIDGLLAHHDDPDAEVRWRVQYALEKIVKPDRVVLVSALHLDDPEWLTRAYAVRTIGRQKSTRGTAYAAQRVSDPEVGVAVNAIRALVSIADSTCASCGPQLVTALGHPNPYVRVTAATALESRFAWVATRDTARRVAMREALWKALEDRDPATRAQAARTLLVHGLRWPRGVAVTTLLRDTSAVVRATVTRSLSLMPAVTAFPMLLGILKPDHSLLERMNAAEALGELHRTDIAFELRPSLADTSALFVSAVAGALAEMGDSASVPAIVAAFRKWAPRADPDARIALDDALRRLAGARLADSLGRALPAPPVAREYPPDFEQPPSARGAILHTDLGDIEWAFYGREAPQTVKNFVRLAESKYFDGDVWHRVVPNFVIQDGDPTGTGSGGPGYTIRCEYNRLQYQPGMVGMALSGKDTGGSQWFITHSPQMHLNGRYTIFAHVTRGMDVVNRTVPGTVIRSVEILR